MGEVGLLLLDTPTILFLTMIVKVFLACVLLGYWRVQRTYPGFGLWVAAGCAAALTSTMYAFRGQMPELITIGLSNLLSLMILTFRYEGVRIFLGAPTVSYLRWTPLIFVYAILIYFLVVDPNMMARTLVLGVFIGAYGLLIAWHSWFAPEKVRMPARWLAVFHVFFVGILWLRAALWFVQPEYRVVLDSNWINVLSYSMELVISIGIAFCLILMNGLQLSYELCQTEENLEVEKERLAKIVDFLPIPMAVYAEDGQIMYLSESWLEMTGYTTEELKTIENWLQLAYSGSEREAARSTIHNLFSMQERSANRREREILTKKGELRYWMFCHAPLGSLSDGRRIVVTVGVDVTERKLAENQIHAMNVELERRIAARTAEWEDLYNNAPCGYHSLDANGLVVRMNDTELGWIGYSRDEVIGKMNFSHFLSPASVPLCARTIDSLLNGADSGEVEYELLHRNGNARIVVTNVSAVRDIDGHFLMTRCSMFDITDRKKAERILREREIQLSAFLDNAHDPIHMTGPDGRFTYVNDAWVRLFGYDKEEARRMTLQDLLHPSESNIGQGELLNGELLFQTKERRAVFIEMFVSERTESGIFAGNQAILLDVTARKEMEEALRSSRDRLSSANLELERAMRVKDEFLAGMSHELRTPLTAVIGLAEVLREGAYGNLNSEQSDVVGTIEKSGRHLLDLINDILDLSKIEAKQVELEIEECSAADVCKASIQFVKSQAQKKQIHVQFDMAPDHISLLADPRRLKQMLINLLSNAVKFTPTGGKVGLSVRADENDGLLRFSVWDTGIGISKDDLPKLFQPFVQIDSSLSRQHAGTGLGLVLVQRTARLHGGDVSVKSEIGNGSRFTIEIPWHKKISTMTGEKQEFGKTYFGPSKVFIVEDNASDAKLLSSMLQKLGTDYAIYPKAEGALDAAVEYGAELVFLDIQLPDRTGWEVLAEFKRNPKTSHLPVIIVSSLEDRIRASTLRASGYLVKPVNMVGLGSELRKAMRAAGELKREAQALLTQDQALSELNEIGEKKPLVLLAEDNPDNVKVLLAYLRDKNWQIILAENGIQAVDQARSKHPDIILMDIQMPEMDGLTAIRHIRNDADEQVAKTPVIALTALAMKGDRERCLEAGANDYVSKPIPLKELVRKMEQLLERGKLIDAGH